MIECYMCLSIFMVSPFFLGAWSVNFYSALFLPLTQLPSDCFLDCIFFLLKFHVSRFLGAGPLFFALLGRMNGRSF